MAKLFLTKGNRDKLAEAYKPITGKDWKPPKRDNFPEIETLPEIAKLMKEKPNSGRR